MQFDLTTYLVLDEGLCGEFGLAETARLAAKNGATIVQLRHKTATTDQMVEMGRSIQAAIKGSPALFAVNDDVEAAIALQADILHIGQSDMPPDAARERIGRDMILGLSVETLEQAHLVDPAIVDYIGAGPVFATPTKTDHTPPTGIGGLKAIVAASPVPAVAIGGLKAGHAADVIATGAKGLAVVSAICGTKDPAAATAHLDHEIRKALT